MKPSQGFDWRDANEPSSFLFLIRIAGSPKGCVSGTSRLTGSGPVAQVVRAHP